MRFLLDTCALLWLVGDPSRLSPNTRADLARHRDSIFVSAFTALEIAIKHEKRRLTLPSAPAVWFPTALTAFGLQEVPVTSDIALRAPLVTLPQGDPADRVIVATALLRSLTLVACFDITVVC
jgi:PIN domain nuclease of toxin-antitoxin system